MGVPDPVYCPDCGQPYIDDDFLGHPVPPHQAGWVSCLRRQLAQRDDEIERLRAIVDQLPNKEDG